MTTRALWIIGSICTGLSAAPADVRGELAAAEDVAVLSAITTKMCKYAASHSGAHYQVLSTQTSVVDRAPSSQDLDPGAVSSVVLRNKATHDLPPLTLCPGYRSAPQATIEAAMAREGWQGFYKAFPKSSGTSYLSLPGYTRDGNVAIVMVSGACDSLCASSFFWVIRKVAGKWTFYKSVPWTIS